MGPGYKDSRLDPGDSLLASVLTCPKGQCHQLGTKFVLTKIKPVSLRGTYHLQRPTKPRVPAKLSARFVLFCFV